MYTIIFIVFAAVEVLIFSTPAYIPMLRQWAMTHRAKRWTVIVVLSLIPTLVNYVGFVWLATHTEVRFASWNDNIFLCEIECYGTPETLQRIYHLDDELRDGLIKELTLRRLFFTGERYCFSKNTADCDNATMWLRVEQERQSNNSQYTSINDYAAYFLMMAIFLSPSFLTGYIVHRITRDNRKQKHS